VGAEHEAEGWIGKDVQVDRGGDAVGGD